MMTQSGHGRVSGQRHSEQAGPGEGERRAHGPLNTYAPDPSSCGATRTEPSESLLPGPALPRPLQSEYIRVESESGTSGAPVELEKWLVLFFWSGKEIFMPGMY